LALETADCSLAPTGKHRPGSVVRRIAMLKLKPLGDHVLVRMVTEEEKLGSIIIPDTAKEKPTQGIVEAAGDGEIDEKGRRRPMQVKQGDRILFGRYAGTEVRLGEDTYMVLREREILAVL
jgi:chaperonin GroES